MPNPAVTGAAFSKPSSGQRTRRPSRKRRKGKELLPAPGSVWTGHVFTDGQMGQEPVEVLLCEFARMSAVVKLEEEANPVEVGLFGAAAIVPAAQSFNHAVVDPGFG
jgi:hypothetical protein